MSRKKINIYKGVLIKLYQKQKLSPYKMGELLGCSFSTVTNRLKEYGIPLRTKAQAHMKYPKRDFDGNKLEKAYLIGFRLGDLNAYIPSLGSETVVVRCHTTDQSQVKLLKQLFDRYGNVSVSYSKYGSNINCFLNKSFLFLLPKNDRVENWIKDKEDCARAFAAGYVDAEGNFILNQGRARFKIDSYDKNILRWLHGWLISRGICSKLRMIAKKNDPRENGIVFNNDLWRINVNEMYSIAKFINLVFPHVKHSKRRRDILQMKKNIYQRIKKQL